MLLIFDMDGTIFEHKNIWLELHKAYGTLDQGKKATEEWLDKDYEKLVDIVIHNLWKGKPARPFLDLVNNTNYLPGVKETITKLKKKYKLALITSGPSLLAQRVKQDLHFDYIIANTLEIKNGIITGNSRFPDNTTTFPVRNDSKVEFARQFCQQENITLKEAIAIGDSNNDIPLFKAVGKSIAFNTDEPELIKVATYHVKGNNLKETR